MGDAVLILQRERNLLVVMRDAVIFPSGSGQDSRVRCPPLGLFARQLPDPQFCPGALLAVHHIVELASVPRETASGCASLQRKLTICAVIMDPDGAVVNSHRREQ